MHKSWEDSGAFIIPLFVFVVLVLIVIAPVINRETLEVWGKLLAALLTPVIAFIAIYIAHQQRKIAHRQAEIARHKLKMDLFDRRLAVYTSALKLTFGIISSTSVDKESLNEFTKQYMYSYFLFDKELYDYLVNFNKRVTQLAAIEEVQRRSMNPTQPSDFGKKREELVLSFIDEVDTMREKFAKHLSLDF